MPVHPYQGRWPTLGARVFLAPGAHVVGDVELGDDVSFWFHTAARGDVNSSASARAPTSRTARCCTSPTCAIRW